MNLLYAIYNFMKYGVRSLVARTQSLESSFSRFFFFVMFCFVFLFFVVFLCLKLVGYSQNPLKSMFLNIFCPFVWEKINPFEFRNLFYVFRVFFEIIKNGVGTLLHWPLQITLILNLQVGKWQWSDKEIETYITYKTNEKIGLKVSWRKVKCSNRNCFDLKWISIK